MCNTAHSLTLRDGSIGTVTGSAITRAAGDLCAISVLIAAVTLGFFGAWMYYNCALLWKPRALHGEEVL